jgi:cell division protein FtsB
MFIFGVTVVLYFIKILSGSRNFYDSIYTHELVVTARQLDFNIAQLVRVLDNCKATKIIQFHQIKQKENSSS